MRKFKIFKQADQFAQPPQFLIGRGSGLDDIDYWRLYGSWFGLTMTILAWMICLVFFVKITTDMTNGLRDTVSEEYFKNEFISETNSFNLNTSNFMPNFEIGYLNGKKS